MPLLFLLLICVHCSNGGTISVSTRNSTASDTRSLKEKLSTSIAEELLNYNGFRQKFNVSYLDVTSILTYSKEIAKAAAFTPFLKSKNNIEDLIIKNILKNMLPSSTDCCDDLKCVASSIGHILADVLKDTEQVTNTSDERLLKKNADNLAGNILWRLSRLPKLESEYFKSLQNVPTSLANEYAQLVRLLSYQIHNSTLISSFCHERGINSRSSAILISTVCGSNFLGYKLGLFEDLSTRVLTTHDKARYILGSYAIPEIEHFVLPSILAEVIVLNMVNQDYLKGCEIPLDVLARDLVTMILLGITIDNMRIGTVNAFTKETHATASTISHM